MKNPLNSENKLKAYASLKIKNMLKGISDKRKGCLLSLHHFFHANTTLTVTSLFTIPLFMWRHDGGRRTRSFLVRSFPHSWVFSLLFLIRSFLARSLYSLHSPFHGMVRGGFTSLTIFWRGHHCFCIFRWGMYSPCFRVWFLRSLSIMFFEIWFLSYFWYLI